MHIAINEGHTRFKPMILQRLLFIILAFFITRPAFSQDTLVRKNGEKLAVRLIEITPAEVHYMIADSSGDVVLTMPTSELNAIVYKNGFTETVRKTDTQAPVTTVPKPTDTLNLIRPGPKPAKNVIFLEMAGNGGFYSLNYERLFHIRKNLHLTARIGGSYMPKYHSGDGTIPLPFSTKYDQTFIPVSVSALYGKLHRLELGLGYTPLFKAKGDVIYDIYNYTGIMIGYRMQHEVHGFSSKCGLIIAQNIDRFKRNTFPTMYATLGYSF